MPCSPNMTRCKATCVHRSVVEGYTLQRRAEEEARDRRSRIARAEDEPEGGLITFKAYLIGKPYPPADPEWETEPLRPDI